MTRLPKLLSSSTTLPSEVLNRACEILCATEEGRAIAMLLRTEFEGLCHERDIWAGEARELVERFVHKQ